MSSPAVPLPVPARPSHRWVWAVIVLVVAIGTIAIGTGAITGRVRAPARDGGRIRTAAATRPVAVTVESRTQLAAPGSGPFVVASTPNAVWVGDVRDGASSTSPVFAIDPRTGATVVSTSLDDTVLGIVSGFDALWVLTNRQTGSPPYGALSRVDPATGAVTGRLDLESPGTGLAVGHGSVWVSDPRRFLVSRVDPATMTVIAEIDVPTSGSIASTNAAVWVASWQGPTISRIDPDTNRVDATAPVAHAGPTRLFVATPTRLWAAVGDVGRERLVELSARTGRRLAHTRLRGPATALAASERIVWVTTSALNPRHRLVAVDVRSGARMPVRFVGDVRASDLAIADDFLFAADPFAGQLVQLRVS